MKTDKTTKILLALIALALWINALSPIFHPVPAAAQSSSQMETDIHRIEGDISDIAHDIHGFYTDTCSNKTFCK